MTATAPTLTPLQQDVIRIARSDSRRPLLSGARSQRPLANPRLEALRRYAAGRFAGTTSPQLLADAGYDAIEREVIDAWILRGNAATGSSSVRQRRERRTDIAAVSIAVASIGSFLMLNAMLLVGAY